MQNKALTLNYFSIICGIWFLFTGWLWTYLINLLIAYPVGLTGLWLWYKAKRLNPESKINKIALVILAGGFLLSVVSVFLYK